MMENVQKIKIKLENIWIDLIRGIYAPYNILSQDSTKIYPHPNSLHFESNNSLNMMMRSSKQHKCFISLDSGVNLNLNETSRNDYGMENTIQEI